VIDQPPGPASPDDPEHLPAAPTAASGPVDRWDRWGFRQPGLRSGLLRQSVLPAVALGSSTLLLGILVAVGASDAVDCERQQPWGCLGLGLLLMAVEPPLLALILAVGLRLARVAHPWATAVLTMLSAVLGWRLQMPGWLWRETAVPPVVAFTLEFGLLTAAWAWLLAVADPQPPRSRRRPR